MALAKLPRVGFPMEAVVYRGILFSAIEACINQEKTHEGTGYTCTGGFSNLHFKFIVARLAIKISKRCRMIWFEKSLLEHGPSFVLRADLGVPKHP
jgi:hypothetical protein